MKKLVGLSLLLAITNLPIGCITDDVCGGWTPKESKIEELSSAIGSFQLNAFYDIKSTDFDAAAIQVQIEKLKYVDKIAINEPKPDFSFINSAYACSPSESLPSQKIKTITITGAELVKSGSKEFESGVNLAELFKVSRLGFNGNFDKNITEFINAQNDDIRLFAHAGRSIVLQLINKPDAAINQKLNITFEFDDSEKIELTTEAFEVN